MSEMKHSSNSISVCFICYEVGDFVFLFVFVCLFVISYSSVA